MERYRLSADGGVDMIAELPRGVRLVCAFGCFDGVHLGHRALLSAAVADAERLSVENGAEFVPAVWTFSRPVSKPWIISVPERLALCGKAGVKYAICQRFEDVRTLSPEEFVDGLVRAVGLRYAVCGFNFRFGYMGAGDAAKLSDCLTTSLLSVGEKVLRSVDGVDSLTVVGEVSALGDTVSSTRIRRLLGDGDMEAVAALLGRRYSLLGTVKSGKQIGRTIARPTANLIYCFDQLIPKRGVYYTYCLLKGVFYRSVTNVGYRPTVNDDETCVTCETHLLDFSETVYGEVVEIIFVHYAREERAFSSIDELSVQIASDVEDAVQYFDALEAEKQ